MTKKDAQEIKINAQKETVRERQEWANEWEKERKCLQDIKSISTAKEN